MELISHCDINTFYHVHFIHAQYYIGYDSFINCSRLLLCFNNEEFSKITVSENIRTH